MILSHYFLNKMMPVSELKCLMVYFIRSCTFSCQSHACVYENTGKTKKIRAFLKTKQDKKNICGQVAEKGLFA